MHMVMSNNINSRMILISLQLTLMMDSLWLSMSSSNNNSNTLIMVDSGRIRILN